MLRPPWAVAATIASLRQKSASQTPSLESCALVAGIGVAGLSSGGGVEDWVDVEVAAGDGVGVRNRVALVAI